MTDPRLIKLTLAQGLSFAEDYKPVEWLHECFETTFPSVPSWGISEEKLARLTSRVIFELGFDSDEQATAMVYAFDGRDFMLAEKYGDKGDWITRTLDTSVFDEVALWLMHLRFEEERERYQDGVATAESEIAAKNGYIVFAEYEGVIYLHVLCPSWMMGFRRMIEKVRAIYLDDGPHRGKRVVSADIERGYSFDKRKEKVRIVFEDGTETTNSPVVIGFDTRELKNY